MKAIILFFSLMFMSYVTAANGVVANINSEQEPAVQSAADLQSDSNKTAGLFDYLKGVLSEDPEGPPEKYIHLADYATCKAACVADLKSTCSECYRGESSECYGGQSPPAYCLWIDSECARACSE